MKRKIQIIIDAEIDPEVLNELKSVRETPAFAEVGAAKQTFEKTWLHRPYGWPVRKDWIRPVGIRIEEVQE